MRSPRRTGARIAVTTLAIALLTAACAGGGATPTDAPASADPAASPSAAPEVTLESLRASLEGQTVTIGTSASKNAALTGVRKTVEFLESDFGVTVEYRELDSDPLVAALISDQISIGQLSLAGTISARDAGAEFQAFAGDDRNNVYIVVAKAPVASLEELRGKPFGASQNLQQITGQSARACLDSAGIDIEADVQLIRLSNTGDIMQAIRAGQVAGGLTAPHRLWPVIVEEGEDAYNVLCRASDVANQINNVWMAKADWIAENRDVALAIAISAMKTGRWSHDNKQEWMDLAMEIDDSLVAESAEMAYQEYVVELDQWPVDGALTKELCDATVQSAKDSGSVEDAALTCEDVVTFEFQEQALEVLGAP
jgi:ABC-type nitrate/sulfonate/bicarbonate transport system substrate-binding protein